MSTMRYRVPMTDEEKAAYASMPLNKFGNVVALPYVPDGQVREYEARWREWLTRTPKTLWPEWVGNWANVKRIRGLA